MLKSEITTAVNLAVLDLDCIAEYVRQYDIPYSLDEILMAMLNNTLEILNENAAECEE